MDRLEQGSGARSAKGLGMLVLHLQRRILFSRIDLSWLIIFPFFPIADERSEDQQRATLWAGTAGIENEEQEMWIGEHLFRIFRRSFSKQQGCLGFFFRNLGCMHRAWSMG